MVTVAVKEFIGNGKWKLLDEMEVHLHQVGAKVQELTDKYKSEVKDPGIRIFVE